MHQVGDPHLRPCTDTRQDSRRCCPHTVKDRLRQHRGRRPKTLCQRILHTRSNNKFHKQSGNSVQTKRPWSSRRNATVKRTKRAQRESNANAATWTVSRAQHVVLVVRCSQTLLNDKKTSSNFAAKKVSITSKLVCLKCTFPGGWSSAEGQ